MPRLETDIPERFRPAIEACAVGAVPANIALLLLLIEAAAPDEVGDILQAASLDANGEDAKARLEAVRRLLAENPQAFGLVKSVLQGVEHGGTARGTREGVTRWADMFDRMARASPEGAVALYALGNPTLLRAATEEVVAYLRRETLLGSDCRVLEIGCGIGRFVEALAPEVTEVIGLDIAPAMIEEARRRCAGLTNATLLVSSGRDLSLIADASVDLVLAADVFPYLVQAGFALVEQHVHEAKRVLTSGGSLVTLNFSYRGDHDRDREDVRRLAEAADLQVQTDGEKPFGLWDAPVFRLVRPA